MKKRSLLAYRIVPILLLSTSFLLSACGKNFFFAGRNLPPSGILNRVLIAEQNPSPLAKGALPFVDAFYDIRHSFDNKVASFSIAGFAGALPLTIQNLPEEQLGAVYSKGDGSFTLVNYATEKTSSPIAIPGGLSSSVFISRDQKYLYAASQTANVVSVVDVIANRSYVLNLPNVYRVSVNPGGSIALAFVQNGTQAPNTLLGQGSPSQFSVYSVVHLTAQQQSAAANQPNFQGAQDCEPQNLPQFCIFPVGTGPSATFDHPSKAVFSPDGSTAYVLNCGPECGGTTSSLTAIPITAASLNSNSEGASGINLVASNNVAIPGGATDALFNGNTLYVAGQCLDGQPCIPGHALPGDGLFSGYLTVLNPQAGQISGTYSISDGTHNRMVFADGNTLWIGSSECQAGARFKQNQASGNVPFGCISMFNTATNTVFVDSYKGDGTGIAAVITLNKVYTAEGGQVYIYNTADGSERDNSNVTVSGTAVDVAYMDANTDGDNTIY